MVANACGVQRQRHQPPPQRGHRIGISLAGGAEPGQLRPLVGAGEIDIRIGPVILAHHHERGGLVWPRHLGKVGGHIGRGVDRDIAPMRPVQCDGLFILFRQGMEIARRGEDPLAYLAVDAVIDHIGETGLSIGSGKVGCQGRYVAALNQQGQVENRYVCKIVHAVFLRMPSRSAWPPWSPA